MFRFLRSLALHSKPVQPAAITEPSLPAAILISREDIYRESRGMEPILLLRKGMEISPADLPRLMRNGARPHQFIFKHHLDQYHAPLELDLQLDLEFDLESDKDPTLTLLSHAMPKAALTPRPNQGVILPMSSPRTRAHGNKMIAKPLIGLNHQTAVILEPDPKSMKRLIDCLFICGMKLDQLHPVRIPNYLPWSLEKYAPQLLLLDYNLSSEANSLDLLWKTAQQSALPSLTILTMPSQATLSNREQQLLQRLTTTENIQILPKPVSRFALYRLLQTELNPPETKSEAALLPTSPESTS